VLRKLIIENYAIIDHIEVEFDGGLNILTGETGAGKSIIVDAVNLLLGERMHGGVLRKGAKKGYIEGIFDAASVTGMPKDAAAELLDGAENGLIVLRREIAKSGGGKTLINGRGATLQKLKSLVNGLIDMHGQHQHQSLFFSENYYEIVDRYGGIYKLAGTTAAAYKKITVLNSERDKLLKKQRELEEKRDYLEFQLKEIREVNPQPDEEAELEREWKILQNAEKITTLTRECYGLLYDNDESAAAHIRRAREIVGELSPLLPDIADISSDIAAALVGVEESAAVLLKYGEHIDYSPERLEEISQRLAALRQIQKKYHTDLAGVLEKAAEIEQTLESDESLADEIRAATEALEEAKKRYAGLCISLSEKRFETAKSLRKAVLERLKHLGMEKSLFVVGIVRRRLESGASGTAAVTIDGDAYAGDAHGIDEIRFSIATGKSERMMAVSQIASGGELSRIMLAIKSALMQADRIPILIFDEIDTGISGRIAAAVGRELLELSACHQLLCVTHLPQIACLAEQHFSVEKTERNGRIVTRIQRLDEDGRKTEIAKLLAGDVVSSHHLKSAEELLKARKLKK